MKIEFRWRQICEILIIHKPSLDHVRSHTQIGPDFFSRFDVYWIQTDNQRDRHPDKQSIYKDNRVYIVYIYSLYMKIIIRKL